MENCKALKKRLDRSVYYLKSKSKTKPSIALFMGTGLGSLSSQMKDSQIIPYSKIPLFLKPTAFGQENRVVTGKIEEKGVISFEGRFHVYEGHSFSDIGFPIRVAHALGAKILIATNIAGGMNPSFKYGDFVVVEDHLNLMGNSPLAGPHEPWMGERFVDMSEPYDKKLIHLTKKVASQEKIKLKEGVYAAVLGPNVETRAEYRYLKRIGADLVGMSTVPEVLVARQLGMRVLVISVISDECNPDNLEPIDVPKILQIAQEAQRPLSRILTHVIGRL